MSLHKVLWTIALAMILTLGFGAGPAQAGKPAKPAPPPPVPVDSGVIYYSAGGGASCLMEPDGSGTATRPAGAPTIGLHAGERWFARFVTGQGTYPSGKPVQQLFLVSDSGVGVELTFPALVEPNFRYAQLDWSNVGSASDGTVSFLAKQWNSASPSSATDLADWGLYSLSVDWTEVLAEATTEYPVVTGAGLGFTAVGDLQGATRWDALLDANYAWSADGASLVFGNFQGVGAVQGIYRTDLTDEDTWAWSTPTRLCADTGDEGGLTWYGNAVLYGQQRKSIRKIAADTFTSSPTVLLAAGSTEWVFTPRWSPNGTHFVYCRAALNKKTGLVTSQAVYRAAADGSGRVSLTGSTATYAWPDAWRDE